MALGGEDNVTAVARGVESAPAGVHGARGSADWALTRAGGRPVMTADRTGRN